MVVKSYSPTPTPFINSASNLANSPLPESVEEKSTRILTVSGTATESPSLLIKENAKRSSSIGEFLVKSTLAPVK